MPDRKVAVVYGVPLGGGGLALQAANAVNAFVSDGLEVHALGPAPQAGASLDSRVRWHTFPGAYPAWSHYPVLRAYQGRAQFAHDTALGKWAAAEVTAIAPSLCYAFTHVARETLEWCRAHRVPSILDSPNGHLRAFRSIYADEQQRWCGGAYRGHPSEDMVARVEEEYSLVDRIRASSDWTRDSLSSGGVDRTKISVLQQPIELDRFTAPPRLPGDGPLRLVFVGSLDLRKGFVYLLQAVRRLNGAATLELVGGTVDRCTRSLLEREASGLAVVSAPGDPRPAFARAEVSVLPTLEDGSPFAAAEAMASGLPLIVTNCCGAREWVDAGRTGWIVPGRDPDALMHALQDAIRRRAELPAMGRAARAATELRADARRCHAALRAWAVDV
jgi:glycosyltransferase involved in cell wall biosynthesis